jgi:hypothetical protein
MSKIASAFYEAGRAVAQSSLNIMVQAISLDKAPSMRPRHARKILRGRRHHPAPAFMPQDAERELLPRLVGSYAQLMAAPDHAASDLRAAIIVETAGILGGIAAASSEKETIALVASLDHRAQDLVKNRWATIDTIAVALLARGALSSNEIQLYLASTSEPIFRRSIK